MKKNALSTQRVDHSVDKASDKARIDRAILVQVMATITVFYKTDPVFKDAVDKLIQAGVDLDSAVSKVAQIEAAATKARSDRDIQRSLYDKTYGICTAVVESHSVTAADTQSCGFVVLDKNVQSLAQGVILPSGIEARHDPVRNAILARAVYASPGKYRCAFEISPEPSEPGTWEAVDGDGVTRTLEGYAPGTWWLRAATVRARKKSAWFGPVAVIVK